jgi:hypothetical protein
MARGNRPRWSSSAVNDGVQTVHIHRKWKHFVDYIYSEIKEPSDFIYRGHRKDTYKLESTLDRNVADKNKIADIRNKQLMEFKLSIRGKRGDNPPIYKDNFEY